jgi:hypothetical protein
VFFFFLIKVEEAITTRVGVAFGPCLPQELTRSFSPSKCSGSCRRGSCSRGSCRSGSCWSASCRRASCRLYVGLVGGSCRRGS